MGVQGTRWGLGRGEGYALGAGAQQGAELLGPSSLLLVALQDAHVAYIEAAARLWAQTYKLPACSNGAATQDILRSMVLPPFVPQDGLHIPTTEGTDAVQEAEGKAAARRCPQELWRNVGTRARNRRPAGAGSGPVTP